MLATPLVIILGIVESMAEDVFLEKILKKNQIDDILRGEICQCRHFRRQCKISAETTQLTK